jgi:hypothetical protein
MPVTSTGIRKVRFALLSKFGEERPVCHCPTAKPLSQPRKAWKTPHRLQTFSAIPASVGAGAAALSSPSNEVRDRDDFGPDRSEIMPEIMPKTISGDVFSSGGGR